MLGKNKCAYADEHQDCRQYDASPIAGQSAAASGIFVDQALGDEDGIVVALTKDKSSQDDVDNVELHAQQLHQPQYPYPADSQWQERHQSQLDAAKRQP